MTRIKTTETLKVFLLLLSLAILADGVSTVVAIAVGYREGNPIINALGGPQMSLMIRAFLVLMVLYRCQFWDRPNRIAVINVLYILSILITGLVAAHNFYLVSLVF